MEIIKNSIDVLQVGLLDNLIRASLITDEMATSLINDSTHALDISKHLIQMANYVFIKESTGLRILEDKITLEDSETANL
jgi:hypothetical protein